MKGAHLGDLTKFEGRSVAFVLGGLATSSAGVAVGVAERGTHEMGGMFETMLAVKLE